MRVGLHHIELGCCESSYALVEGLNQQPPLMYTTHRVLDNRRPISYSSDADGGLQDSLGSCDLVQVVTEVNLPETRDFVINRLLAAAQRSIQAERVGKERSLPPQVGQHGGIYIISQTFLEHTLLIGGGRQFSAYLVLHNMAFQ